MKLKELTVEMLDFQRYIEDNHDIDEQTKTDTLNAIALNFEKKALNVAYMVKNIETPISAIDNEIKRLQAHKNAVKSKVDWLKGYLKENMEAAKIDVIENDLIKIRLQNSAPSLEITCEVDKLPEVWRKTKIEIVAEKALIKKALSDGVKIEGCKLNPSKHIRIY